MGFREKKPHERTRQRKLGELSLVSEEIVGREHESRQRIIAGTFELTPLLDRCHEVRAICAPDRGFIRLKVARYYNTYEWRTPDRYSIVAFDTNAHGYDWNGCRTGGRLKSGANYKRPPHDLCAPGHVSICWGYRGADGDSFFASLSSGAVAEALRELEEMHGGRPTVIEVRLQMVWLKPDDTNSTRALMSWGLS